MCLTPALPDAAAAETTAPVIPSPPADRPATGSEYPSSAPHTPPRLYLPYGTLRAASNRRRSDFSQSPIHWFRVGRPAPVLPYERLILGYRTLPAPTKLLAERLVDEFFSEDEFRLLRDYLRERHHEDLRTSVLMAPVNCLRPDTGTRVGARRPFALAGEEPGKEVHGLYVLSDEPGYRLPFAVSGFYLTSAVWPAAAVTPGLPDEGGDHTDEEDGGVE